jgi:hypothetical protein
MKGKIVAVFTALTILMLAGCDAIDNIGISKFNAKIIQINGNSVTVEPMVGEDILRSGDRLCFSSANLDKMDITIGDIVSITYTGTVRETYPGQIDVIRWSLLEKSESILFEVSYYRTDCFSDDIKYPQSIKINSEKELSDYCDTYQFFSGITSMFDSARFDRQFFEDYFLLFVVLEEGSGSVRHQVESVQSEMAHC